MDAALFDLLQSAMVFRDRMSDLAMKDRVSVRLSRRDGLALLGLVSGCTSPFVEYKAHDLVRSSGGINAIDVAGLTFEWPSLRGLSLPSNEHGSGQASLSVCE